MSTFDVRTKMNEMIHRLVHEIEIPTRIDGFQIFREDSRKEDVTSTHETLHHDSILTGARRTYGRSKHDATGGELSIQTLILLDSSEYRYSWTSFIGGSSDYHRTEVLLIGDSIGITI